MDASAFGDFLSAAKNAIKSFNGEGKWTPEYAVAKTLTTGAKLFGSSASNLMRDIESIYRSILIGREDWDALYNMEKRMYDVNNEKSRFMDILYQVQKSGDTDAYNEIVEDLVEEGISPSDIRSAMTSRAKKDEDVKTDIPSFDSTLAGIGIQYKNPEEKKEDDKFTIDSLSGAEYIEYTETNEKLIKDIVAEFERNGLGKLDDETANDLLAAAYDYAEAIALEEASDGKYDIETKWILAAEEADEELGLSVGEFIMLKEEYGATALTSEGIYKAYDAGVEAETYLEFKADTKDFEGDDKKERFTDTLLELDLPDEQLYALYFTEYDGKNALLAQEYGIPADLYMTAVVAMDKITPEYDANGKEIKDSRRIEIEKYLNSVCSSYKEWLYLLGTEFPSVKKEEDYIMYFGKE